jgi:hypothetical protein
MLILQFILTSFLYQNCFLAIPLLFLESNDSFCSDAVWFLAHIREGKSPDDKKNSAFSTKFFANFHYFCVLFPSSRRNSTTPQHFTMHHYSAKQHSGIIYYISQQSHVTHQLVLWNLVVIHIIIVVNMKLLMASPGTST